MILETYIIGLVYIFGVITTLIVIEPMFVVALIGYLKTEFETKKLECTTFVTSTYNQSVTAFKIKFNTILIIEIVAKIRTKYLEVNNYLYPPLKDTLIIKDGKMIAYVIVKGKIDTIEIPCCTLDGTYKVTVNDEPAKTFTDGVIEGSEYSNTYAVLGKHDSNIEVKVENSITEESVSKTFSPGEPVDLDWVTV